MSLRNRFRGVIERIGEALSIGSSETKGIVTVLEATDAPTYLTTEELGAARPLRLAYVPFDVEAEAEDTVHAQELDYSVLRTIDLRHQGETFARMLVLAPT